MSKNKGKSSMTPEEIESERQLYSNTQLALRLQLEEDKRKKNENSQGALISHSTKRPGRFDLSLQSIGHLPLKEQGQQILNVLNKEIFTERDIQTALANLTQLKAVKDIMMNRDNKIINSQIDIFIFLCCLSFKKENSQNEELIIQYSDSEKRIKDYQKIPVHLKGFFSYDKQKIGWQTYLNIGLIDDIITYNPESGQIIFKDAFILLVEAVTGQKPDVTNQNELIYISIWDLADEQIFHNVVNSESNVDNEDEDEDEEEEGKKK